MTTIQTPSIEGGGRSTDDRAIAARLAARDEDAVRELYRAHGPMVFGVCQRVLQNRALAEDATQEVFLFLWERPDRFDPARGTLRSWLGLLAHRRSVDRVRAETRRARTESHRPEVEAFECGADEQATARWISDRVREALGTLPADQRDAVILAYFGDRTYVQVAEELGLPEGTVKSRIRLALKKLDPVLRQELGSEEAAVWS